MNPDLSKDRELVECAKVMLEAVNPRGTIYADEYLAMADAGYRLPEATEKNAERLARAKWDAECKAAAVTFSFEIVGPLTARKRVEEAAHYLRALHAMMADQPEKPEPVFPTPCPSMQGDNPCEQLAGHEGPHSQGHLEWEEEPEESHVSLDVATQSAKVERRRLIEAFMLQLVGNPAVMAKLLEFYGNDCDADMGARVARMAHGFAKELAG